MSVRQYVIATTARDSLTGLSIPGLAGSALVADGAGGATWGSAAAAPTNLLVYVSTTGDNKNDGATALTAVATIDAASAIALRRGWNVSANIRLLPGVHDLAGGRIIRTDGSPGVRMQPLIIESDSLALIGSYSVLSATIVGNLLEITISAPVPAGADGESIRFTSGALNSTRAVVGNVTGSSFTIMYNGATPSPGDTFVLEATTATINILAGAILTGGTRMLRNLRVNLPPQAGGMPPLLLIDMTLFVSGVRFTASTLAGAFVVLSRSTLVSGGNLTSLPGVEANPLGMTLMGFGGMPNVGLLCHGASALSLQGCYFRNAQILATNCSALGAGQSLFQESLCIAVDGACWNLDQSRILNAVNDGINATNSKVRLTSVDISASANSGASIAGSDLRLESDITSIVPNGNTGVLVDLQGRVATVGTAITITGTANSDVVIGVNTPATWNDVYNGVAARHDFSNTNSHIASVAMDSTGPPP